VQMWLSVDPLAEKFPDQSPYSFVFNNPLRFIDPDGRAPLDWIKNNTSGKFEWRNNVTSASNTPSGYSYVGKDNNSIITNLFGTNNVKDKATDVYLLAANDFDNPHSAKGVGFNSFTTQTTLSVSLSADVTTKYDKEGNVESKDFNGVNIDVSISGNTSIKYAGAEVNIAGHEMTLQGNEMDVHKPYPGGEIRQRGNVPTLTYDSYWNSSSIQSNFNKSFDLNFSFKGQYRDGKSPLSYGGPAGLTGLPNYVKLKTSINFNNSAGTQ
jgi:hypothetical protein